MIIFSLSLPLLFQTTLHLVLLSGSEHEDIMACSTATGGIDCQFTSTLTTTITSFIVTTLASTITTTQKIVTTYKANPGGTVTIDPPPQPSSTSVFSTSRVPTSVSTAIDTKVSTPSIGVTPVYTIYTSSLTTVAPAPTVTLTEIEVVSQDTVHNVFTTSILTLPVATNSQVAQTSTVPLTVVAGQNQAGRWNSWSASEKGGLIAGCVLAFLIIVIGLVYCYMRKRRVLVENSWSVNSHPGVIVGHPTYGYGTSYPSVRGGGRTTLRSRWLSNWYGAKMTDDTNMDGRSDTISGSRT